MLVEDDLGKPVLIEDSRRVTALGEVIHEPVPIIVVARVMVVELGRVGAFGGRAKRLFIPVDDDLLPVGVERRDEKYNSPVENLLNLRRIRRSKFVQQFDRFLTR